MPAAASRTRTVIDDEQVRDLVSASTAPIDLLGRPPPGQRRADAERKLQEVNHLEDVVGRYQTDRSDVSAERGRAMDWSVGWEVPPEADLIDEILLAAGKALYVANRFEAKCSFVLTTANFVDLIEADPVASLEEIASRIPAEQMLGGTPESPVQAHGYGHHTGSLRDADSGSDSAELHRA